MTSQQRTSQVSESVSPSAIFDASGRFVAPPQTELYNRPERLNGGPR